MSTAHRLRRFDLGNKAIEGIFDSSVVGGAGVWCVLCVSCVWVVPHPDDTWEIHVLTSEQASQCRVPAFLTCTALCLHPTQVNVNASRQCNSPFCCIAAWN